MKAISTGLALGLLLASSAMAGESPSGWKWDKQPPAEPPQAATNPLPAPDCARPGGKSPPGDCTAKPATSGDDLESTLAPPSAMAASGNRQAKKAGN